MYSDLKERIMPHLREMDDIYSGNMQKIIAILDEYEQRMKGAIEWTVSDIMTVACTNIEHPYEMDEDLAQEILEEMIEEHDANFGVTWETVAAYVEKNRP